MDKVKYWAVVTGATINLKDVSAIQYRDDELRLFLPGNKLTLLVITIKERKQLINQWQEVRDYYG